MSKSKGKRKNQAVNPQHPPQSLANALYDRLSYLNNQFPIHPEYQQQQYRIEHGDLLAIKAPYWLSGSCDYDIWIGRKTLIYAPSLQSIFAMKEGEHPVLYRRRIAEIPKLRLYLRAFSGKIIGYNRFEGNQPHIELLWDMWVENGYLNAQNRSEITALSFPLDRWLLKKWIHSWQCIEA